MSKLYPPRIFNSPKSGFTSSGPVETDAEKSRAYFGHLKTRLRRKLLFVYFTPLAILSLYVFVQQYRTLRVSIDLHLMSIAENKRNTVDLFLGERVANVRNLFYSNGLRNPATADNLTGVLAELRRESATFVDVGLFQPDGTLVTYAGPFASLRGRSYRDEDWFVRLFQSDKDYFLSDVYRGFRNKPHFTIAARRVVEGDTWTLRAVVDPAKFSEFINTDSVIGDVETESFILNRQGERQTLSSLEVQPVRDRVPSNAEGARSVDESRVGDSVYLRAWAGLTSNDWTLVVQVNKDEAYAPLVRSIVEFAAAALFAFALITVVVLRQTNRLVAELEQTATAKESLKRKLFHAAKLASIGEMAAGVAHEINNPLAIIYEEAGMIKDQLDPSFCLQISMEAVRERLDAVMAAAMRGRAVAGKLLTFARQSDGEPERLQLNQIATQALLSMQSIFKKCCVKIVRDFDESLPEVYVGAEEMTQVIINLLSNGTDAMVNGGILTVRTLRQDDLAVIEIQDTGCGMSEEVMEKAFFPFFTTKGVGKGTGLGLSISYGIVKTAGGRMEISSVWGQGTTVSVFLPIHQNDES